MRPFLEHFFEHAFPRVIHQKAVGVFQVVAGTGKKIVSGKVGHHADVARHDPDIIVDLNIVCKRIDPVFAGAEHLAHDPLEIRSRSDDLAFRQIFPELTDQHAEFTRRDVRDRQDLPIPGIRIEKITAFPEHLKLDPFIFGGGCQDHRRRQIFPRLADQNCDLTVARFDPAAVPDENGCRRQHRRDQRREQRRKYFPHRELLSRFFRTRFARHGFIKTLLTPGSHLQQPDRSSQKVPRSAASPCFPDNPSPAAGRGR